MAKIVLKNLSKVYPGGVPAVHDFSLEIGDREFVVLVGPSGCGKSTTLRMLAGLEEPTGGKIFIDERDVTGVAPKERDVAMVFQNYALYPHMTAYRNMAFGLMLRKVAPAEIDRRVRAVAQVLGISDEQLQRKPKALSGGERQRVAVGRAIVRQPRAFLFDEPLSNLDAQLRVQMRAEISKLHRRLQTTMVYVTHDQVEAMTMGDRIVVMHDGVIQQVDEPMALYERPRNVFVAGFIGSPAMNFVRGTIDRRPGGLFFCDPAGFLVNIDDELAKQLAPEAGRAVVFGCRAENVVVRPVLGESHDVGTVEVVEPVGAEVFVYLKLHGHSLVARVRAAERPAVGQAVAVSFETAKCHLFEAATGRVLSLPGC